MNIPLIFLWVIFGFVSWSFWEAYIEGKNAWGKKQVGWKKKILGCYDLTAYHFWLNLMLFFFMTLPLIINGWNTRLFGVLISASALGFIIQDILWYVINPFYSLKKFNPKDANWYPWIKIGKFQIPRTYLMGFIIGILSWYFLWG